MTTKWEYTTLAAGKFGSANWGDVADHGKDGWELVSVIRHHDDLEFYFKRPLVEGKFKNPKPHDLEWVSWTGGECPVNRKETVVIRQRNGMCMIEMAGNIRWKHNNTFGKDQDIIAYKPYYG